MSTCPFCAGTLPGGASRCPQCGRDLSTRSAPAGVAPPRPAATKSGRGRVVAIGCGCVGAGVLLLALLGLVVQRLGLAPEPRTPPAERSPDRAVVYALTEGAPVYGAPQDDAAVVRRLGLAERLVVASRQGEWVAVAGNEAAWVRAQDVSDRRPLNAQEREARIAEILAELRGVPDSDPRRNRDLYAELMVLAPDERAYATKHQRYAARVEESERASEEARRQAEEVAQREREERAALIAKFGEPPQLDPFSGAYRPVERYLERVANDPDSIEMEDCTKVYRGDHGWLVSCDYRGKNAFGAVVWQSNWFTIVHGEVVSMHEAGEFTP